ncbi:MAG: hypothetical protein NZ483_06130 [Verrucomicrobiae bacterium]|nr:hypothetical protein [Verrucomicrobiae bacterium]MDW8344359.1 hypothetical protein [Verrucomicrobiae bacterium]
MRWIVLAAGLVVGIVSGTVAEEKVPASKRVLKYCDPVCELQAQDMAFSLLLEAYRQNKAYRIQSTYEARLNAASAMSEAHGSLLIQSDSEGLKTLRAWVMELAEQERQLAMEELQRDVERLKIAYGCARRADEQQLGLAVPSKVDLPTAAQRLASFNIVAGGKFSGSGLKLMRPSSAQSILLDAAEPNIASEGIESCETH